MQMFCNNVNSWDDLMLVRMQQQTMYKPRPENPFRHVDFTPNRVDGNFAYNRGVSTPGTTCNDALGNTRQASPPETCVKSSVSSPITPMSTSSGETIDTDCSFARTTPIPQHTEAYIDTHCHIDFLCNQIKNRTLKDFDEYVQRNSDKFPSTFVGCIPNFIDPQLYCPISPEFDPRWIEKMVSSKYILAASIGVHPHWAYHYTEIVDDLIRRCVNNLEKFCAIGECGLDLARSTASLEAQTIAFRRQLKIANMYSLPVIVHCRDKPNSNKAEEICLEILQEELQRDHPIHRHCYEGSLENLKKWANSFPNAKFGLKPSPLFDSDRVALQVVKELPLDKIILETDSPFFSPHRKTHGRSSSGVPGNAVYVGKVIADVKEQSLDAVLSETRLNSQKLYNLEIEL
ncbi:hypothetical protein WR25_16188 isoform A [Diploscapter pachys]|uniref:TatD related DNase n=1 Tax=Diploscapter pachys TaxID=2018661 RepID=A0A2A2KU19_9BILA|nr:hypothetical protein WR25_16188 isoform A [Diploscapter pachys]